MPASAASLAARARRTARGGLAALAAGLALAPPGAAAQPFGLARIPHDSTLTTARPDGAPRLRPDGDGPITAIDWLDALNRAGLTRTDPDAGDGADDVARSALPPDVRIVTLGNSEAGAVGLLPGSVTGLPVSLWQGSDPAALTRRIEALDVAGLPAMQELLMTLLLAEADPPATADPSRPDDPLLLARIDKLAALGALDPALALIDRAGPQRSPALFERWFDLSLLTGAEADPCRRIAADPARAPSQGARIFCLARNGDWQTAALLLETARALGSFDPAEERLLTRFLHVELDEDAQPLPPPAHITPLLFRLSEAIGEPLPTSDLPRAYAYYDLRGRSGWKAALDAAERLARSGALPENRLLGLYSGGRPSASGGIWDRVAALQAFDAAIGVPRPDPARVRAALPPAWDAMRAARLETAFAALYADRLMPHADAPDPAGAIAIRAALLAPGPGARADVLVPRTGEERFLFAVARGTPRAEAAPTAQARIVARGFAPETRPPAALRRMIGDGRLGEAILAAMQLCIYAMQGDRSEIAPALATFRAVGLEQTARAAALQILLLDHRG